MKQFFLAAIFIVFTALALQAQVMPERENEGVTKETRTAKRGDVYQDLKLSKEQQEKLKLLNQENKDQMQAIRNDDDLTQEQKKIKYKELADGQREKRKSILTPEQNAKMEAKMKEMRNDRRGGMAKEDKGDRGKAKSGKQGNKDLNGLSKRGENNRGDWTKDLNLTADQKIKMKDLNEEMRSRMQSIRDNSSLNQKQKRDALENLQKEVSLKRKGILTAEQELKWEERERQMRAVRPEGRRDRSRI